MRNPDFRGCTQASASCLGASLRLVSLLEEPGLNVSLLLRAREAEGPTGNSKYFKDSCTQILFYFIFFVQSAARFQKTEFHLEDSSSLTALFTISTILYVKLTVLETLFVIEMTIISVVLVLILCCSVQWGWATYPYCAIRLDIVIS